ncbi:hypothetical protein GE061_011856, partial [Apolygus lucorum]
QCDQDLVTSWKGADEQFLCSVAQYAQLKRSLERSHKDLGPITIEKLKGFTAYLTQMARETKESLCQNVMDLYSVRCQLHQISLVSDENLQGVNSIELHSNQDDVLKEIENLTFTLKQFAYVLNACPERSQFMDFKEVHTVFSTSINRAMVNAYKHDDQWDQAKSKIDTLIRSASKLKDDIIKSQRHRSFTLKVNPLLSNSVDTIILEDQLGTFQKSHGMLRTTAVDLQKMIDSFGSDVNGSLSLNPLTKCLEDLTARLTEVGGQWKSVELPNEGLDEKLILEFSSDLNRLVHNTLIFIQNVYKSHVVKGDTNSKPSETAENADQEEIYSLEDGHLKEKIIGCLDADFSNMKIPEFSRDLADVLLKLNHISDSSTYNQCLRILRNAYPLLDQLAYLFQFFLTQQTSTLKLLAKINALLLGIFTEFAKNGYNVPEELRDEGEEGEGQETKGGMGLGEGEGEKDVSDQIESLDQLEDAKRPEDYKNQKEEHKDCKEEEKGINMEEDMDGELQDLDKKENEEGEDEDEDDDDPDKEMGDTEKGAEALDKEVWGSDSEEEDEGDDELPEDEGNRGSEQTEKEMRAKNDERDGDDEQGDDQDKRRDQKKPEINEMEDQEMDDDQIDPYHGNHPPTPEVEPLDIPDDLDMNGDDSDEEETKEDEENPFDIDKMKERAVPEDEPENEEDDQNEDGDQQDEQDKGPEEGEDGEHKDFSKPELIREEEEQEEEEANEDENKENEANAEDLETEDKTEEEEETGDAVQVDKPSDAKAESSEDKTSSSDQVTNKDEDMEQNERRKNDHQQDDGRDEDGTAGAAEKEETDQGGRTGTAGKQQRNKDDKQREDQKRQRPGDSNIERSLGEANEPVKKKLKTIEARKEEDRQEEEEEKMEEGVEEDDQADLYQHIKEAKENSHDTQVIDAATKEQAAEQKPVIAEEDEEGEALKEDDEITQMDEDVDEDSEEAAKPKADKTTSEDSKKDSKSKGKQEGDVMEDATIEVEIEGEVVPTMSVPRGPESTYHTRMDELTSDDDQFLLLSEKDVFRLRQELQEQLATWSQPPAQNEATEAWEKLSSVTSGLSRDLSEQLRLVLEPTTASGLKGDFRTGRRINMRKVIPYIASQFRKDKIWLRRSKPSKREYQIVMAIDDSSSMADNQSKELAFESLALVSKALTLLEAGDLAVLSFGESIKVLHELGQPFTDSSGARLVQQLTFDQKRTKVGALVDYTTALLSSCAKKTDADVAQLLVILSDGRGVMSEGEASVLSAVRSAKHNRIFMIFVIIESPNSKDSILDIRQPCFKDGKLLGITSYMDNFPFPFYLILRDINNLPSVLSDALRQWFELVTNSQ